MIHRLLTPQVLDHPALRPWFYRSVLKLIPGPERMVAACEQISALCAEAHSQVLLGIEEERPVALLVSQLPTPLMLYPTILLAYNEGSKAIGGEMVQEAARWMRGAGYAHFLMTNRSGRGDAAYERILRPHGTVIERATTLLVELKEEEQDEVQSAGDVLGGVRAA